MQQANEQPKLEKVLLVKPCGESVWCTRITHQQQTWVACLQIHTLFLQDTVLQSFKNGLKKHGVIQRLASQSERRFCAFTKAIGAKAASCTLLELTSLCQMLQNFIFEPTIIQTIASIKDLTGQSMTTSQSSSTDLQPMPLVLPNLSLSRADLAMSYSLHTAEQNKQPVKNQVQALIAWLTEPVQLDRAGPPCSHRTKENILQHIWQYLGFLQLHMKRDEVSLWNFLDMPAYAQYMSFHRKKGNVYSTIVVHITSAKSVLQYLAHRHTALASRVGQIRQWMSRVQKQLAVLMPKAPADFDDLPKAHIIVRLIQDFTQRAFSNLPPIMDKTYSDFQARAVHDATLASCMFGYLPPVRLVCLRTLQMPLTEGCLRPGCTRPMCQGNRLLVKDNWHYFLLSHYKVERRWKNKELLMRLPEDLHLMFTRILNGVAKQLSAKRRQDQQYVFMDTTGQPMLKSNAMTNYWAYLLKRMGASFRFPPHSLRHIFIHERRSASRAEGPEDFQAAMTMGNSVNAWTKFYDRHFQRRECQAGIDTMRKWREQLLRKETAALELPSLKRKRTETVAEENSDNDSSEESDSEGSEGSADESEYTQSEDSTPIAGKQA